ncbi:MAG: putative baseplate assembly protein, partial [Solirubrobacteraceae bacterium]
RKTVTMNANVVVATHGETVAREILGGGDGSQANQRFTLRRPPLTHISDITPSGAASTLEVRVDDVLWDEAPVLYGLGPRSRRYIVRVDDDGKPSIVFGDGQRGARPPTGTDNIVARYRSGIGNAGMVGAGRLTLLRERPLGIASVTNPLPAGGAAEPENRDAARENAPLTVLTMERIVSLRDFEDFARGFAGIGKAQAIDVWRGAAHEVHVTVAPADGGVLLPTAPLLKNLVKAIDDARDPGVAATVEPFAPRYFELDASVRIAPEYLPEKVLAGVRTALLDAFSFARRSFGQPVTAAEVVEIAQGVPGVVATYLLALTMTTEETAAAGPKAAGHGKGRPRPLKALARPLEQVLFVQRAHLAGDRIVPAELLVINPGALSVTEHAA